MGLEHAGLNVESDAFTLQVEFFDLYNKKKVERTLEIMQETYADSDVIFLQEAAAVFIEQMGATDLSERYHIFSPEKIDAKRDQNSLVLASKAKFTGVFSELTASAIALLPEDAPVSAGDLLAAAVDGLDGNKYVLASFHGDTNGLATIPVVEAVNIRPVDWATLPDEEGEEGQE